MQGFLFLFFVIELHGYLAIFMDMHKYVLILFSFNSTEILHKLTVNWFPEHYRGLKPAIRFVSYGTESNSTSFNYEGPNCRMDVRSLLLFSYELFVTNFCIIEI